MILPHKYHIYEYEDVTSTMDIAADLLWTSSDPSQSFVVLAKSQSAGKGQHGKKWQTIDGNLFATLVFPLDEKLVNNHYMGILCGVSVLNALLELAGGVGRFQIKWPNDILLDHKKVGGLLIQKETMGINFYLVGIGVNLRGHPSLVEYPAGNIQEILGVCISRKVLVEAIMVHINKLFKVFIEKGFGIIREFWMQHAFCIDGILKVSFGNKPEELNCLFKGIDSQALPIFEYNGNVIKGVIPLKILWNQYHFNNTTMR